MIANSADRIPAQTAQVVNDRIRRETDASVAFYAQHPDRIDRRLRELDDEWDTERVLQLNSSALSLLGVVLSATVSRKWLLLPGVVAGFLLQNGVLGWSPPGAVLRRLTCRTRKEIDAEKFALRVQRGDFRGVEVGHSASSEGPGWG